MAVYCYDNRTVKIVVVNGCAVPFSITTMRWWSGLVANIVGRINEVNQCRACLVLGWPMMSDCPKVCKPPHYVTTNQPPRSTQPGHS